MARYYDMDKLKEMIEAKADTLIEGKEAFLCVAKWLELMPSADVVPKSELDISQHLLKDAWKRIEELGNLCGELQKAKTEVAREIFAELETILYSSVYPRVKEDGTIVLIRTDGLRIRCDDYNTIKKRYTEDETDDRARRHPPAEN